ncbi:HAD family hydrolase [Youxingia wuxianensis]|uniref:HAD family hydrolase n=1 Tax=Youxingia wuxianensis TaxID=2763678 RepID=A0A926IGK2_9FIRM|nr:HAD family hydrolase [Youxingia wuxianensis]MBC8584341.1 HAD family hydrolase [Youxingia wuxianensis]
MKKRLSDLVIISDVDGTLLPDNGIIPPRNLQALERFTKAGGRFALATGRLVSSITYFFDQIPMINAPCILFNGGAVYDYKTQTLVYSNTLPQTFKTYLLVIMQQFPEIAVVPMTLKHMYAVAHGELFRGYSRERNVPVEDGKLEELSGEFFKVNLAMPPQKMPEVFQFVSSQGWTDVEFVSSSEFFLEMIPKGTSKGNGVLAFCEKCKVPLENVVVIGDYYNDVPMLKCGAFPVTVANAPQQIKEICQLVVGSCDDGALADLVEYLEKKYTCLE